MELDDKNHKKVANCVTKYLIESVQQIDQHVSDNVAMVQTSQNLNAHACACVCVHIFLRVTWTLVWLRVIPLNHTRVFLLHKRLIIHINQSHCCRFTAILSIPGLSGSK